MKIVLLSISLILLTSVLAVAQPPDPPPPDPPVVPISGLEYLLIGGASYGIYRFSKKRSKNNEA